MVWPYHHDLRLSTSNCYFVRRDHCYGSAGFTFAAVLCRNARDRSKMVDRMKLRNIIATLLIALFFLIGMAYLFRVLVAFGPGAFQRHLTISGIYSVCKPNGYDSVCFLDADSKDGGLSCIPFNGVCK